MQGSEHCRRLVAALVLLGVPAFAEQPELAVPYSAYTLPLSTYAPTPGRVAGVLVRVRVNGGPLLRLLLDTGSADVVLDKQAALRSGLSTSTDLVMVCAGGLPTKRMKAGLARTVEIGAVSFRNYPVDVAPVKMGEGLDGVLPISIFRGFLLRLDLPGKTLGLSPYPQDPLVSTEGFAQCLPGQDLLFVRATLNRTKGGYILIDTGSSYTAVSRPAAEALKSLFIARADMWTAEGDITGEYIAPGVQFEIAGREFTADPVVALDLSTMSRYHNVEVAALLGYPDLRSKVLTVNYRDLLVKIEGRRR